MAFRDDNEAARQRTRALERELEETAAQLEGKDAELEDKDAELRALRAQLAKATDDAAHARSQEVRDEQQQAERRAQAEQELAEVKLRGRERAAASSLAKKRERERRESAADRSERAERERMGLVSVSRWGDVPVFAVAPLIALPTFYLFGYAFVAVSRWLAAGVVTAAVALVFGLRFGGRGWARRQWRLEQSWAEQLDYSLEGYPEMLQKAPGPTRRLFLNEGAQHQALRLEVRFRKSCSADELRSIFTSFDSELSDADPFVEERWAMFGGRRPPNMTEETKEEADCRQTHVLHRHSPTTVQRSKSGTPSHADHNRAVQRWVRRLEREVLGPLHARYGIERVSLRLR